MVGLPAMARMALRTCETDLSWEPGVPMSKETKGGWLRMHCRSTRCRVIPTHKTRMAMELARETNPKDTYTAVQQPATAAITILPSSCSGSRHRTGGTGISLTPGEAPTARPTPQIRRASIHMIFRPAGLRQITAMQLPSIVQRQPTRAQVPGWLTRPYYALAFIMKL